MAGTPVERIFPGGLPEVVERGRGVIIDRNLTDVEAVAVAASILVDMGMSVKQQFGLRTWDRAVRLWETIKQQHHDPADENQIVLATALMFGALESLSTASLLGPEAKGPPL